MLLASAWVCFTMSHISAAVHLGLQNPISRGGEWLPQATVNKLLTPSVWHGLLTQLGWGCDVQVMMLLCLLKRQQPSCSSC